MRQPDWQSPDGAVKLFYGDCLPLLAEMEAESVDCVVTDPPYGHNNNDNNDLIHRREAALGRLPCGETAPLESRPIANDGAEANEIFREALPLLFRALSPGCCCCCCCGGGGGGPDPQFARWSLWIDEVFDFKQMVVWDKGPMGMGWHYRRSYETVLIGQKPGAACRWLDQTGSIENIIRPGYKGIRKIIPQACDHPTPKPVELAMHFIGLHARPGETVLDPFMGAGWVGLAALAMGRKFIGVELDQRWFALAVSRIQAELSRFPLLEPTGPTQTTLFGDEP